MNIEPLTYVVIHHFSDWDREPEVVLATTDLGYATLETEKVPMENDPYRPEFRQLEGWHKGKKIVSMYKKANGQWHSEVFDA